MKRHGEHRIPGRLFIVEGVDGSGKSTQLMLLHQWLKAEGYGVVFSEWNSSPLVKDTTKRGKKKQLLTPATFSLIHATDFADRTERNIIPLLKAGAVVLCDRYIYTAFARDVSRGMDAGWIRELYAFAVKPTIAFYFRVPLEVAMKRIADGRAGFKFYEAGMDLGLSKNLDESFRLFQGRILGEYEKMVPEFGLTVIDATQPIETQQKQMRQLVLTKLTQAAAIAGESAMKETYGCSLPGLDLHDLVGKLIVIEGTDGVGRSTQMYLLKEWLEQQGRAVLDTGLSRSGLVGKSIKRAKEGHTLGRITLSLFYTTDFADRLENEIIPALRAGFVVLTDRYIYSLMARAMVRGLDPTWVRNIHSFALKPDAVFYLRIGVNDLIPRAVFQRGFDYWESGMDLYSAEDMYDSFRKYQSALLEQFDRLAEEFHFEVVDARPGPMEIFETLREGILRVLDRSRKPRLRRRFRAVRAVAGAEVIGPRSGEPAAQPWSVRDRKTAGKSVIQNACKD